MFKRRLKGSPLHFAREINNYLEKAREAKRFDELVIAAEPHFLGILLASFTKPIGNLVQGKIRKDLIFLKDHELHNIFNLGQDGS